MTSDETFDVVLLAFDERAEPPEAGLRRVFGIDEPAAKTLLAAVPTTVQRGVNRVRAEFFRRALESIGGVVNVRTQDGTPCPPLAPSEPPPKPERAAAATESVPSAHTGRDEGAKLPAPAWPSFDTTPPLPLTMPVPELAPSFTLAAAPPLTAAGFLATMPAHAGHAGSPAALELMAQSDAQAEPWARGPSIGLGDTWAADGQARELAHDGAMPEQPARNKTPTHIEAAQREAAVAAPIEPFLRAPAHPTLREGMIAASSHAASGSASGSATLLAEPNAVTSGSASGSATLLAEPQATPANMVTSMPRAVFGGLSIGETSPPIAAPALSTVALGWADLDLPSKARAPVSANPSPKPKSSPIPSPRAIAPISLPSVANDEPLAVVEPAAAKAIEIALREPDSALPPPPSQASLVKILAKAPQGLEAESHANAAARKVLKGIPKEAPWTAPSPNVVAAERRKQALRSAESNLAGGRDALPLQPRWEMPEPGSMAEPQAPLGGQSGAAPPLELALPPTEAAPKPKKPRPVAHDAASVRPQTSAVPARSTPRAKSAAREEHSFWLGMVDGCVFSLRGSGGAWIFAITAYGALATLLGMAAGYVPVLGAIVSFVAHSVLLSFCAEFHRRCMWSVIAGNAALDAGPTTDPTLFVTHYVKSGLNLSLFAIVSQLPLSAWLTYQWLHGDGDLVALTLSPIFWLPAAGPAFYWPMAVGTASLSSDFFGVWSLRQGMRALFTAPLEYVALTLLSALVFGLSCALFLGVGVIFEAGPLYFQVMVATPLALAHGTMGALMGHLARARPDAFA